MHLASDLVLTYIQGGGDERAGGGVFEPGTRGIVEGQADPFTEYLETRDPSIRDPASLATPSSSSSSSPLLLQVLFARLSFFSPLRVQELDPRFSVMGYRGLDTNATRPTIGMEIGWNSTRIDRGEKNYIILGNLLPHGRFFLQCNFYYSRIIFYSFSQFFCNFGLSLNYFRQVKMENVTFIIFVRIR